MARIARACKGRIERCLLGSGSSIVVEGEMMAGMVRDTRKVSSG